MIRVSISRGTARAIWGKDGDISQTPLVGLTNRYYQTYNDGANPYDRMDDATASQDLQSVANILDWTATAGHQGVNWFHLYLQGSTGSTWGEKLMLKSGSMTMSVNGETGWRTSLSGATPVYDTVLGGTPETQNAISPDFNPATQLFSVTGDFFVDENGNGVFDAGDTEPAAGEDYTIWFYAKLNNWTYHDDYGNWVGGNPGYIEGTITARTIPEPASVMIWGLFAGLGVFMLRRR